MTLKIRKGWVAISLDIADYNRVTAMHPDEHGVCLDGSPAISFGDKIAYDPDKAIRIVLDDSRWLDLVRIADLAAHWIDDDQS